MKVVLICYDNRDELDIRYVNNEDEIIEIINSLYGDAHVTSVCVEGLE